MPLPPRITVRKTTAGGVVQGRREVIEVEDTATVTWTVTDDEPNHKVRLQATAVGGGSSDRVGWWPRAGLSLGSAYEAFGGYLRLIQGANFPVSRAIAAASPEFGWTWLNRTCLTADENTTTAGVAYHDHNATSTDWWGATKTGAYRYRSSSPRRPGMERWWAMRVSNNSQRNWETTCLMLYDGTYWIRICLSWNGAFSPAIVAHMNSATLGSAVTITTTQRDNGVWLLMREQQNATQTVALYYSLDNTDDITAVSWRYLTAGWPWPGGAQAHDWGYAIYTVNTFNTFETRVRRIWTHLGEVDTAEASETSQPRWNATQYDTTSQTQWCGPVDLGSGAPTIDIAALRLDLASRVNLRPGDTATVQWSLVRSAGVGSPGAGTWYAAASLAASGSGRYLHLYVRITSTGDTQGSVWWGDSGPAVRAA
jgi:hypothetical protein